MLNNTSNWTQQTSVRWLRNGFYYLQLNKIRFVELDKDKSNPTLYLFLWTAWSTDQWLQVKKCRQAVIPSAVVWSDHIVSINDHKFHLVEIDL